MARLAVVFVHITLTTLLTVYADSIAGLFEHPNAPLLGVEEEHVVFPSALMLEEGQAPTQQALAVHEQDPEEPEALVMR